MNLPVIQKKVLTISLARRVALKFRLFCHKFLQRVDAAISGRVCFPESCSGAERNGSRHRRRSFGMRGL